MNAGVILKDSTEEKTQLVFLSGETECCRASTNDEIIELIKEREPEVVAVDAGTQVGRDEFNEQEEELKEEGYSFTPTSHETKKARRLEALKARLFEEMGAKQPEIIRFEPRITAEELALHDESALGSLGVDASGLESSEQFDAMLGAVTARFYEQNQVRDLGVVIPEPLGEQESK
ncbi:MAG: hypothetical protein ABEJ91_03105 [Candidatus Nanohaloarchaea archaeon]